jgi:hypothetical protein
MAIPAVRIGRPPLLLALLLALIAGLSVPPLAVEQTAPSPAVSAPTTRHSTAASAAAGTARPGDTATPAEAARHGDAASVTVGPAGAPVAAGQGDPVVRDRARVLRTQQFFAVRAARAPPAATI